MPIDILSTSTVYPTPASPERGLFVRARLESMGERARVKVIAPLLRAPWARSKEADIPAGRWDNGVEVLHPRCWYLPGSGALTPLVLFAQLVGPARGLRREHAFQVIDAHFLYPDGVAAHLLSAALGVPFTVTLRGSELLHSRYPLRRLLMARAVKRASRVMAVSGELADLAVRLGAPAAQVKVIPNGVDSKMFYPRHRAEARRKLGWAPDRKLFMTAGRLIELKGHHHAIAALKILCDEGQPVEMLIAGGNPGHGIRNYGPEIRRLVEDLKLGDRVHFAGNLAPHEMAELMSAVDIFCLASDREGWPNVVHEAMACGTPVVATAVGAVREMIRSAKYGLIVPPNDPRAMAGALRAAFARDWDHAAISAWACARTWQQVGAEVVEQLEQVLEGTSDFAGRDALQAGKGELRELPDLH